MVHATEDAAFPEEGLGEATAQQTEVLNQGSQEDPDFENGGSPNLDPSDTSGVAGETQVGADDDGLSSSAGSAENPGELEDSVQTQDDPETNGRSSSDDQSSTGGTRGDGAQPEQTVEAGTNNRVQENTVFGDMVIQTIIDSGRDQLRELTPSAFDCVLNQEMLAQRVRRVVCDAEVVDELLTKLMKHRLLFLVGGRETGKSTMGMLLAKRLCDLEMAAMHGCMMISRPSRYLRIVPRRVTADKKQFGRRVLLFRDALGMKNQSLSQFFENCNRESLTDLQMKLKSSQSYLVFTLSDDRQTQFVDRLFELDMSVRLPPLPPGLLQKGLEQEILKRCPDIVSLGSDAKLKKHMPNLRELSSRLGTMNRIVLFAEWVPGILRDELSLEEALSRANDLKRWFQDDVSADLRGFCFGLALILCSAPPSTIHVTVHEFQSFRIQLYAFLCEHLKIQHEPPSARDFLADQALLSRVRAEIKTTPGEPDIIRFCRDDYAERLWDMLEHHAHGLTTALLSWLESQTHHPQTPQALLAARALGRLGRRHFWQITMPLIETWACKEETSELVGFLFQGVLASPDKDYQIRALSKMRSMFHDKRHVVIASLTLALLRIGEIDLVRAVSELNGLLGRRFSGKINILKSIEKEWRKIEHDIVSSRGDDQTYRLTNKQRNEITLEMGKAILGGDLAMHIMNTVQYALVGLCLILDPAEVLGALGKKMAATETAPIVAILFLRQRGMAEVLGLPQFNQEVPWEKDRPTQVRTRTNWILVSIALDDGANNVMRQFLVRIFKGLGCFPPLMREILQLRFNTLLKKWIHQARYIERCETALVQLIAKLAASPVPEIRNHLFDLLNRDKDFTAENSIYAVFAEKVFAEQLCPKS